MAKSTMMSKYARDEEGKKEFVDTPEVLDRKVTRFAEMILSSEHFIAHTGAGISTACGIPDYRSGANTINGCGAGAWEKHAIAKKAQEESKNGANRVPNHGGAAAASSGPSRDGARAGAAASSVGPKGANGIAAALNR